MHSSIRRLVEGRRCRLEVLVVETEEERDEEMRSVVVGRSLWVVKGLEVAMSALVMELAVSVLVVVVETR